MKYYPPDLREVKYILEELMGLDQFKNSDTDTELTSDFIKDILTEASKFSAEVLAPLYSDWHRSGPELKDGAILMSQEMKAAYHRFSEGGWGAMTASKEFGGFGFPKVLGLAVEEIWHGAHLGFGLCSLLTQGAAETILQAGTEEQKRKYLPNLISGRWAGTMNLTESQAGSDLSVVTTTAIPETDGTYRITGQKIFITYGDHDLTENIIHLVLARLPNSPQGVKGLSLFIVPKYLIQADGGLGEKNFISVLSNEHKLGLQASPTCVLKYGQEKGAWGELLGSVNQGLSIMFMMMNQARFSVGVQGLAMGARAYQGALAYAKERIQGVPIGGTKPVPIINHGSVHVLLSTMKVRTEASRFVAYYVAYLMDQSSTGLDESEKQKTKQLVDLLIPVVKSFCTEHGVMNAHDAIQVMGGMGYMEESGMAQVWRDARITTIYEGTTQIQANDLMGRKIIKDGGETLRHLFFLMRSSVQVAVQESDWAVYQKKFLAGLQQVEICTEYLIGLSDKNPAACFSVAPQYQELLGWLVSGWWFLKSGSYALHKIQSSKTSNSYYQGKWSALEYFMAFQWLQCQHLTALIHSVAEKSFIVTNEQLE